MSLEHKTTERVMPKDPNSFGSDNVVPLDRVLAVKGPRFYRYLAEAVGPTRQDVATMALQVLLQKSTHPSLDVKGTVARAFEIADEFCVQNATTLEKKVGDYFDLFMKRGEIEDLLKAQMEEAHDYSL